MKYYIRIEMLPFQTPIVMLSFSLTLCQISEHLRDARLTKLIGQFIKANKHHFLQRLENVI